MSGRPRSGLQPRTSTCTRSCDTALLSSERDYYPSSGDMAVIMRAHGGEVYSAGVEHSRRRRVKNHEWEQGQRWLTAIR